MNGYKLIRPLVYRVDAEETHDRTMRALAHLAESPRLLNATARIERFDDPRLGVSLFGRRYPHPLTVAAGLDKQGVSVPAFKALGFSFVEVGTVTLYPQTGNPKPRVFRLPEDEALINRMGFPSPGVEVVAANLRAGALRGAFALNVGPNKERVDHAAEDCLAVIARLIEYGPVYLVVNVSSPNTAKLRDLQGKAALTELLGAIKAGMPAAARQTPLLVKIAPELTDAELDDVLQVARDVGMDGIVATNTTVARPKTLLGAAKTEQGGLSGRPLREAATRMIARIHEQTAGTLPIVAAGGVFTGADVLDKIGAGATMVQTYTGLIYQGPGMAKHVKREMAAIMTRQGISSIAVIRGTGYRAFA